MHKALKEAKVHTSWINANDEYERAVRDFVAAVLERDESADGVVENEDEGEGESESEDKGGGGGAGDAFLPDFEEFQRVIARAGMLNSLSQTLLKTTAPGVPDFYQGTELWAFTLVDPDNRRPVDYELRRAMLSTLREVGDGDLTEFAEGLLERPEDGRVKMYVTTRALGFRRERAELFARGEYLPLRTSGRRAESVVAFARARGGEAAIAVAARFFTRLGTGREGPLRLSAGVWGDTALPLGDLARGRFRDVFTGREFAARDGALPLAEVLSPLPVALLTLVTE